MPNSGGNRGPRRRGEERGGEGEGGGDFPDNNVTGKQAMEGERCVGVAFFIFCYFPLLLLLSFFKIKVTAITYRASVLTNPSYQNKAQHFGSLHQEKILEDRGGRREFRRGVSGNKSTFELVTQFIL